MSDPGLSDLADEIKRSDTQELALRLATVESIEATTVTVRVAASTNTHSGVDYVGYAPKVGDVVLVFQNGPNLIIWGIPGTTGGIPTGAIIAFGSEVVPPGYLLCNGQSTSGYPALAAVRGANVPDLRDKFIVGTGPSHPQNTVGGVATNTAIVTHTHTLNNHEHTLGNHNHPGFDHTHGTKQHKTAAEAGGFGLDTASGFQDRVTVGDATTGIATTADGSAYVTGGSGSAKTGIDGGGGTVPTPAGSVASLNNEPPYYALTYIIKT